MFFFNWFSRKSRRAKHASTQRNRSSPVPVQARHPAKENHDSKGKTGHPAGREQLYEAIREAMTRVGILSASYKFKVLDLDQQDSNYLVMVDLTSTIGDALPAPGEMEALIVQNAMLRYQITVSAVYWRRHELPALGKAPLSVNEPVASAQAVKKPAHVHEPIHADEVAAFQRALQAASSHSPAVNADAKKKIKRGMRQALPLQDFEDTEVFESVSYPAALSATQYGDLH